MRTKALFTLLFTLLLTATPLHAATTNHSSSEDVNQLMRQAEQGFAEAQYALGECYEEGEGVEQDLEEAAKWYRLAAEQGHEDAKEALEKMKTK